MTITSTNATTPLDLQDERLIAGRGLAGAISTAKDRISSGQLGPLPVIVGLLVIGGIFQILNPNYLSAYNVSNLLWQSAAVGLMALGVVVVLLLGEIDLSVGSVAGLSSAVFAVGAVNQGWPEVLALVAALVSGVVVGMIYGFFYTRFGVPSFLITLAGLLALQGLQRLVISTGPANSIALPRDTFLVQVGQTFVPLGVALGLLALTMIGHLAVGLSGRRRRLSFGLSAPSMKSLVITSVVIFVVLSLPILFTYSDGGRGIAVPVLIFVGLTIVLDIALRRTGWGRSVYAIGGNVEAARRAGIKVDRVYISVFVICSTLAAIGGLMLAARAGSASVATAAADENLNAIAAAVIGGTSLFGGRGRAWSALLGILVIYAIFSGLNLLSLPDPVRYIIIGGVLLVAVVTDSLSRRTRQASGRA
ncbi:sugar ABC transporter permease [Microbacterium sp. Leaf159]|uniref:sugar ABC transporter permease n=1 Tax=Microbacterium sp. Leaf159 TaxID=1736279 RepID=UPI0006F7B6CE|nr:ABC transporter permease [Microbacterium sp. Leaf159]KQR37470.1 ABC transporter permease [Microbacterium sp. Leaf159]